jgi:hypothetical protein
MQFNRLLFLFGLLFTSIISFAQAVISGQVVDADTKLPLEGASVFAQNTTKGAVTDKEGHYRLYLNKGGYELVTSYTSYVSKTVNVEANADKEVNIELKKEDKSMEAVVITSSNKVLDGWEKYGDFFLNHFIGTTPLSDSCVLLNPEVVDFYY